MNRFFTRYLGGIALTAALAAAPGDANALDRRDVIGGMSASAVMGIPYSGYPTYSRNYHPGYSAPVHYAPPLGPPPGCAIRQQRVWDGYGWRWRKLRICH